MKSAIVLLAIASLGFCQDSSVSGLNGRCGGNLLNPNTCAAGLVCVRPLNMPDVAGTCQYSVAGVSGATGATDTQTVVATASATAATTSNAAATAASTAPSTTKVASFGTSATFSLAAAAITFIMA
ncbi:hypothetical protein BCR33DRAFT_715152 [Rhizoclosmatium globosum]|uniref:CBM1 domain-containing protein n=1 Tax=Rhizoclosmatium globosum TaxID=329046 RepID=A0A1Y2BI52_9FUNG|nr:hypothetical protein BCR33DRAFT_722708 [Rhizoclosmatium globosum]ORY47434.1 hypothetical protein BCR33DRAFT_715152 [Rhizoclosmatium globosum]|eukprot:ORY34472.1 hypothetical protein BCR33DRAFT_722708 [Rhizoclosmatium globosum]